MSRLPSVLVPYPGRSPGADTQDVVLYLRPESNGVLTESTILRVIRDSPAYRDAFRMVYLANLPGDFIVERRIVEQHYALKLRLAREGKKAFTPTMVQAFQEHFHVPFHQARILGAFQALEELGLSARELFHIWVPTEEMATIHGQTVKRHGQVYVVNYDIPALLKRNSAATDVFAMVLRCTAAYRKIHEFIADAGKALNGVGILDNPRLYSHVFHYSKGPFEQVLDGLGYLYAPGGEPVPPQELSFLAYLLEHGAGKEEVLRVVREPIVQLRQDGTVREVNLFVATYEQSYSEALATFSRVIA